MTLFLHYKMGIWPLLLNQKKIIFLLTFFGHVLIILAWTKCRLVTKHVLSITHFHSCLFLTFPLKYYVFKKFKLSNKDYLLLIHMFMGTIQFWRSFHLSVQSHQMCTFCAVWNGAESVRTVLIYYLKAKLFCLLFSLHALFPAENVVL